MQPCAHRIAPPLPPPPSGASVYDAVLPNSLDWTQPTAEFPIMPLIAHLKAGFDGNEPPAWHRNAERRARGLWPVHNTSTQLEGWERQLVWLEVLILTGNLESSFRHLARGWGRDKGFHTVLAQFICERYGNVERKKRVAIESSSSDEDYYSSDEDDIAQDDDDEMEEAIGANFWDETAYHNASYNEALAADLFDFSPEEFMAASKRFRVEQDDDDAEEEHAIPLLAPPPAAATVNEEEYVIVAEQEPTLDQH